MTAAEALSAITGIQNQLSALRGMAAPGATSALAAPTSGSTASVFAAILAALGGSTTTAEDSFGQQIVDDARGFLGTPYVLGGTTTSGIDCSGLVKTVLAKYGIDAPHHSGLQGELGTEVPSLAEAKPGDLLVLNDGHHIGIYAGDGKVIHAPSPGKNVVEQKLWTDDSGIVTIRRLDPPAEQAVPDVDVSQIVAGLAMLGNLGSLLGSSSALGASGLGASGLGGSSLGIADLNDLQAQRWALLAKGTS